MNNNSFPAQKKKVTRASLAKYNDKVKKYAENNEFMNIIKEEKNLARKNFEYFNHEVCEGDLFEIVLKKTDKPLLVVILSFEKEKELDGTNMAPSLSPRKKAAKILGYVLNTQQFIIFSSRENELSMRMQNPLRRNHDDTFNGQKIIALRLNYRYVVHKLNFLFRNNA